MTGMVTINRTPVLTLWAAVVAERLGFDRDEALTLGRVVAGLNAQTKGRRIGIFAEPSPATEAARRKARRAAKAESVELLGRNVPVVHTSQGIRAAKDGEPESPEAIQRYLATRFGDALEASRTAMTRLAAAFTPEELALRAYPLYESFRPEIPAGAAGWGARGVLSLERIERLAQRERRK